MGHHHHGGGYSPLYGIRKARREEGRALARQARRGGPPPGPPIGPRELKAAEVLAVWFFVFTVIAALSPVIANLHLHFGAEKPPCVAVWGSPATIKYNHDQMFMEYEVPVLDDSYTGTAECREYNEQGDVPYAVITKWKLDTATIMKEAH